MGIRQIVFLFLDENICCGYSLEVPQSCASNEHPLHMPQQGASNEYSQHMNLSRKKKKNRHFLVEKSA